MDATALVAGGAPENEKPPRGSAARGFSIEPSYSLSVHRIPFARANHDDDDGWPPSVDEVADRSAKVRISNGSNNDVISIVNGVRLNP
jgi:hypothetical protein